MRKCLLLLALIAETSFAQNLSRDEITRIADYSRLWNVLYFFHPTMAYNELQPDSLFLTNIDVLLHDPSAASFKNAVNKMTSMLNDPYTVVNDASENDSVQIHDRERVTWLADSTALVYFDEDFMYKNRIDYDESLTRVLNSVKNAHAIIFDIRKERASSSDLGDYYEDAFMQSLVSHISDHDAAYPSARTRIHNGYEADATLEQLYKKGWASQNGYLVLKQEKLVNCPVVLVINRFNKGVSDAIACMQYEHIAKIVAEDSLGTFEPHSFYKLDLADNVSVDVRLSEIIYPNGEEAFAPDTIVQAGNNSTNIIAAATALFHDSTQIQRHANAGLRNYFASKKMNYYESLAYPPAGLRLFTLARYWGIINYFSPNKDRIDKNWDSVLYQHIPKFLQAKDSIEYTLAAARLIKEINDTHGFFSSPLWRGMHTSSPELQVGYLQLKTIIYKVFNDSLSKFLSPGDEILKIDDIDVNKFRNSIAQYIGASNNASLNFNVNVFLLSGKENDPVKITVNHKGTVKDLVLPRKVNMYQYYYGPTTGPAWKKINENVGYVDLGTLEMTQIDSMFTDLKNSSAIIFDDRSYPNGTAWTIKNYFTKQKVYPAIFTMMVAASPSPNTIIKNDLHEELLPDTTKPLYNGKIIMLVNDRTVSQAEYTCMIFQAASKNVTIIGSQTAGADGDISIIQLPGGIRTAFSGLGVHYPDGRQAQGIGIVPNIVVTPTIKGIAEGKDEVLQRAITFAETGQ